MHILTPIGYVTRGLQRTFPKRPIQGMSRLGNFLRKRLPSYNGTVIMNPGFKMQVYTDQGVEMDLFLTGSYNPALAYVLSQFTVEGGYYLDVGANIGFFSLMFAYWASQSGKVAAFEPNPKLVARLQNDNRTNKFHIDIIEKVVHDKAGERFAFYISASSRKSSIYRDEVTDIVEEIIVETTTVDKYVEQAQWSRVDMIKMDIEGNDCKGLLGGVKM